MQENWVVTPESNPNVTLELATELTVAWLANPNTRASADDVPVFLNSMHSALGGISASQNRPAAASSREYSPAVSVRKSLASRDHIISLIDGKPYKTLRRHLARHGLTPEQYRERFGLKPDYPMVSENYSEVRRDMAKRIGLGRKPNTPAADAPADQASPAKPRRGRRRKSQDEPA
jgi:predicted transcriptional regulator